MHVCQELSQISLGSPHQLIRDDTFCLNWIFPTKRLNFNETFHKSRMQTAQANLGQHFAYMDLTVNSHKQANLVIISSKLFVMVFHEIEK